MIKPICLFLFLVAAMGSCFGQDSSSKYEFLKYNSQKTKTLKQGRNILIFTTDPNQDTLLKKRKHFLEGKIINVTDSIILIQLTQEHIDLTYVDSAVSYNRQSYWDGYLSKKEVSVSTIQYITYEPNLHYVGIAIAAIGMLGTVITPLIALNYRDFSFNNSRYVSFQVPFMVCMAVGFPTMIIFEKKKLRLKQV